MKTRWIVLIGALLPMLFQEASGQEVRLFNPYERPKNGPPLNDVIHKTELSWLFDKLKEPGHLPAARMPEFGFTDSQVLDIMAYLEGIAAPGAAPMRWPDWAEKTDDDMTDDEWDAMFEVVERGKAVWRQARCTICHTVVGPGGTIGGFVDLRVGGIGLDTAAAKLKRDWLYSWIQQPKDYFPDTLMPRYRLTDNETRALVEFILRDDSFRATTERESDGPESWGALEERSRFAAGKQLVEVSRCVICHDIEGNSEIISQPSPRPPPPTGTFEFLAYDLRCLSCHSIAGRGGTYAPDLTTVGSRLREDWITTFVESPDMLRPLSQQMPMFGLSGDEARIISSYLIGNRLDSTIAKPISAEPPTPGRIERGRKIFGSSGCIACHSAQGVAGGAVGPDLTNVAERLQPGYVSHHLVHPHEVNAYSPEPDLGLSAEDADALEAYLSARQR